MFRSAGIDVPIIPGIKPLAMKQYLASVFSPDLPEDLFDAVEECKDNTAAVGGKRVVYSAV